MESEAYNMAIMLDRCGTNYSSHGSEVRDREALEDAAIKYQHFLGKLQTPSKELDIVIIVFKTFTTLQSGI